MMKRWLHHHRVAILIIYGIAWSLAILAAQILELRGALP